MKMVGHQVIVYYFNNMDTLYVTVGYIITDLDHHLNERSLELYQNVLNILKVFSFETCLVFNKFVGRIFL